MLQDNGSKAKQIVVVGHKPFIAPNDPMYIGMQVGFLPDIPSLQRDNTGDNIAEKNRTYCELTASHLFNILIAPKSIFDSYSQWLFEVLAVVEQRLDISGYSPVEQRVFGYLSELLLDTWIHANNLHYAELPMLFLQRQNLLARYAKGALRKAGIINPAAQEQKKMTEARQ